MLDNVLNANWSHSCAVSHVVLLLPLGSEAMLGRGVQFILEE